MTKQHFEAFAARIKADRDAAQGGVTAEAVRVFDETAYAAAIIARVAEVFNPRFDRARFMRACGIAS